MFKERMLNNVDMSSLRAPWQNGPYKNKQTEKQKNPAKYQDTTDIQNKLLLLKH